MAILEPAVGHLLRRAGFGATEQEAEAWNRLGVRAAIDKLVDYELTPNPVDDGIGGTARLGITSNGPFNPNNEIVDARQRWLFRMVYTEHPLQEKMALFWHDHFATGYGKLTGQLGGEGATRALANTQIVHSVKVWQWSPEVNLNSFETLRLAIIAISCWRCHRMWRWSRGSMATRIHNIFPRKILLES